jgi:HipA-like protein
VRLDARRVLAADKRGSSWPVVVDTDEGRWFTKLRGAAQGTGALVAEVIVAELAESLGMRVPARRLVRFGDDVESVDRNDELADLLRASAGVNLGFAMLDGAIDFAPVSDLPRVDREVAAAILWLDGLVMNPDRTARNPNLLWWNDGLWLIDHGASLGFQYALPDVSADAARRPYALREPHLFQAAAPQLADIDASLAARVTESAVERAVDAVPDEFLLPLVASDAAGIPARRAAYVDYLRSRLEAPRPFLAPEVVSATAQRARVRPPWIVNRR